MSSCWSLKCVKTLSTGSSIEALANIFLLKAALCSGSNVGHRTWREGSLAAKGGIENEWINKQIGSNLETYFDANFVPYIKDVSYQWSEVNVY